MIIQQISVFLENRPGALAEVLEVLGEREVNIRAMSVADTADFGIVRFVVNRPAAVETLLRDAGFTVKSNQVLSLALHDQPGSLLRQVKRLGESGINVEYFYAFAGGQADARIVFKVDDIERAAAMLGEETAEVPEVYW